MGSICAGLVVALLLGFSIVAAAQQTTLAPTLNNQDTQAVDVVSAALSALTRPQVAMTFAQLTSVAAPARAPQAVAIFQAAIKAMGGTAPSDSTANGTVSAAAGDQSQEGTIQILTRGTDQSLEQLRLTNLSQTVVYSRWMGSQTTGNAAQAPISGQQAATSQSAYFPLPLLAGALSNSDVTLEYIGSESIAGVAAQHIRMWNTFASHPYMQKLANFSIRDVWIDATSNLPVRIAFTQQVASGYAPAIPVKIDLANYQNVGGFLYPYLIKKSLNGSPWLTISIQSVAFNSGLSDSNFPVSDCNN